jgi:hypothetical protein
MESITFGQCFRGAWKDTGLAILNRPVAALITFALLMTYGYMRYELRSSLSASALSGLSPQDHLLRLLLVLCSLMQWVAMTGLSVQVMRYSLFGAESSRSFGFFDKGFRRYLRLSSVLVVFTIVLATAWVLLGVFALHRLGYTRRLILPVTILSILVVAGILIFFYTRLSLLFCNAAIGARASWGAAWSDTHGHFWSITFTHFVTNLPNVGFAIVFAVVSRFVSRQVSADTFAYWSAVGTALSWTIVISSSAACSAWLYRRFSSRMLETG